jgi:ATP-dependent DNA helicase RecQ
MILDYFGDPQPAVDCRCDVCRRTRPHADDEPMPQVVVSDEVSLLVRQMLSAIARLHGKFGVGAVADVLTGADNERTQKWGHDQLSVFGLLRHYPAKRLIAMLHRLMEAGLARQKDPDGIKFRPVMELTAAGLAVMKGEQPPHPPLADLIPRTSSRSPNSGRTLRPNSRAIRKLEDGRTLELVEVPEDELDPDAVDRFERLRTARLEQARQRQLPPYCIVHDSTLKQIALLAPGDLASLAQVKGMGPHKLKMYGDRLLEAIG